MRITITLSDKDGGTEVVGVHEALPAGVSIVDNEAVGAWRLESSLRWSKRTNIPAVKLLHRRGLLPAITTDLARERAIQLRLDASVLNLTTQNADGAPSGTDPP